MFYKYSRMNDKKKLKENKFFGFSFFSAIVELHRIKIYKIYILLLLFMILYCI